MKYMDVYVVELRDLSDQDRPLSFQDNLLFIRLPQVRMGKGATPHPTPMLSRQTRRIGSLQGG